MIGAWALIRGNTVLGCFPSIRTLHRFGNQEVINIIVIKKKLTDPLVLTMQGNFP